MIVKCFLFFVVVQVSFLNCSEIKKLHIVQVGMHEAGSEEVNCKQVPESVAAVCELRNAVGFNSTLSVLEEAVRKCISLGVCLNHYISVESTRCRLVDYAAYRGDYEKVRILIKNGADPDKDNSFKSAGTNFIKSFALLSAVSSQRPLETVNELLKYPNINVNKTNHYGKTALMVAAYLDQYKVVKRFLDHRHIDLKVKDIWGHTLIDYAIFGLNPNILGLVLGYYNDPRFASDILRSCQRLESDEDISAHTNGRMGEDIRRTMIEILTARYYSISQAH